MMLHNQIYLAIRKTENDTVGIICDGKNNYHDLERLVDIFHMALSVVK